MSAADLSRLPRIEDSVWAFGFNADVGTSLETIWDEGGLYTYPGSVQTLKISSDNTNDAAGGTGAHVATIEGLDSDYNVITETVSLNGQTAVTTVNTYARVNQLFVNSAGSGETNAGAVYAGGGTVTNGVPADKYSKIVAGHAESLKSIYTVPNKFRAHLMQVHLSTGGGANAIVTARFVAREENQVFRTKEKFLFTRSSPIEIPINGHIQFPAKTDLEIRAFVDSGTIDVTASFGLRLSHF